MTSDGRPATSRNKAKVRGAVRGNRRITTLVLLEDVLIIYGSVQFTLTEDLGMRSLSAKFVSKLLSADQETLGF